MKKTPYYSWNNGKLPKGCQLCVQGKKLVLFVTGLCPRCCYYCPISDKKYRKDVIYADEWPVTNIHQIIEEAKLINAKGAGITGGDPLCRLWRALFCIRRLKKEFGKGFHIHLYTSLDLVNEKNMKQLYKKHTRELVQVGWKEETGPNRTPILKWKKRQGPYPSLKDFIRGIGRSELSKNRISLSPKARKVRMEVSF